MSLAEQYQEFRQKLNAGENVPLASLKVAEYFAQSVQRAFYAGAEAALNESILSEGETQSWAEIDHFRSHK